MTTTPKRPITPPAALARRTTQAGPITPPNRTNRKSEAPIAPPAITTAPIENEAPPVEGVPSAVELKAKPSAQAPITPPERVARKRVITPPRATKKVQPPAPATPNRPPITPPPVAPPTRTPFDDDAPTVPITPPPPLHQQEREGVTAATQDSAVVNEAVKNAPDKDKPVINAPLVNEPVVSEDAGAMPPLKKQVSAKQADSGSGSEKAAPMAAKENAPRAPITPPKRAAKKRAITPPARPRNDGPPPMRGEPIRPPAAMKEQMARARQRDSEAIKSEEGNEFGQTLPADYEYETPTEAMFYNVFGGTDDIMGDPDPLVFMLANRAMPSPKG